MVVATEQIQVVCNSNGLVFVDSAKFVQPAKIVDATHSACSLNSWQVTVLTFANIDFPQSFRLSIE